MKKTTLVLLSAAALFLTACDITSSEEIIKDSDFVLIINHAPSGVCDLNAFQNKIIDNILPYATLEILEDTNKDVTCDTYGLDTEFCDEVPYPKEEGTVSCVIGADTDGLFEKIEDIVALIEELVS
jgi:hypothetical protein